MKINQGSQCKESRPPKERDHTVEKILRDAANMKRYSRYVIELNALGDVTHHYENQAGKLDCIVVLAPGKLRGKRLNQAVALEIGLSRFVPYKFAEFKSTNPFSKKQVRRIAPRARIGVLPWSVIKRLLPVLWHAIQTCVDKRMETWTRANLVQKSNGSKGFSSYESWLTIRIPNDQPLIHAILRFKDEQDRCLPDKNYAYTAEIIHREMEQFKRLKIGYKGNYPDEVIKKSHSLWTIAGWMKKNIHYRGYTNRSFEAIQALLGRRSLESLRMFKEVCRIFKVPSAPRDAHLDHCELVLGQEKDKLVKGCTLRPCRVSSREKKRTKHAKNCYTISIFGSPKHLIRLHERNIGNRLGLASNTAGIAQANFPAQNDDDIPWFDSPPAKKTGTDDSIPF